MEEEERMFVFTHVRFEVSQRHLSGSIEKQLYFLSLDFRREVETKLGGHHSIDGNWSHWHG